MNILKYLADAITDRRGTSAYDTAASVIRTEGTTAWVHIPGGVVETPVEMTINCKPGDTVKVRVSGGSAYIIGNTTAPPSDDGEAIIAKAVAKAATITAKKAKEAADKAVMKITTFYGMSNSPNTRPTQWSTTAPTASEGIYIWEYTETKTQTELTRTEPVCVTAMADPSYQLVIEIASIAPTSVTYAGHLLKGTQDITSQCQAADFTWKLESENGTQTLGTGTTCTVLLADVGYGATVILTYNDEGGS